MGYIRQNEFNAGTILTEAKLEGEFDNIYSTGVGLTEAQTLTNKTLSSPTLTSPVINVGVSGTAILDEDDMASDSDTHLATQQSIKAYIDTRSGGVSVYRAANQAIGAAAWTKVQYDTEEFDTNTEYDPVTNFRFTPTTAGKYTFYATVRIDDVDEYNGYSIAVYKNGTIDKGSIDNKGREQTSGEAGNAPHNISCTATLDANGTTDYFEIFVNFGTAENVLGSQIYSYLNITPA
jgi:hypothetical protein